MEDEEDDFAKLDENEENWVEEPYVELEAIAFMESDLLASSEETVSNAAVFEALHLEPVIVEADDSLDEGLDNGCLSVRAASQTLVDISQAVAATGKHVSSFRKIVHYFSKRSKAKDKLISLQDVSAPLTVISDVATRWNSTHHMICRLLELRPTLQAFPEFLLTAKGREEFSDAEITRPTGEMWFYLKCLDRLLVFSGLVAKGLAGDIYQR
ncbi:hypothetical protein GN958_ATG11118 [Phytophthora infestans]|uniref:Uncharacterized protein n=1 Tax=Phytophthora infestans TaxID=4787 RepID=A0A8S9UGH1_PHYIN|nr:hypothetical protein GN958_ATG11118 [Phytophthora infestans]